MRIKANPSLSASELFERDQVNQGRRHHPPFLPEETAMMPEHAHGSQPRTLCAAIRHARRSLCNRLERMASMPDEVFCQDFATVVAEVEAGFRREELAMEMLGYAHLREHREENAVILRALHRALPEVDAGDCALGRQLVAALRQVLALHRLNADLALSLTVPASSPNPPARARGRAARTTLHVAPARRTGR
jgi:hemerythrin